MKWGRVRFARKQQAAEVTEFGCSPSRCTWYLYSDLPPPMTPIAITKCYVLHATCLCATVLPAAPRNPEQTRLSITTSACAQAPYSDAR